MRNNILDKIEKKFNLQTVAWLTEELMIYESSNEFIKMKIEEDNNKTFIILSSKPYSCNECISIAEFSNNELNNDELLFSEFIKHENELKEKISEVTKDITSFEFPDWFNSLNKKDQDGILDGMLYFANEKDKFDGVHFEINYKTENPLEFVVKDCEFEITDFFNSYDDTGCEKLCTIKDNLWCIAGLNDYAEFNDYFKL